MEIPPNLHSFVRFHVRPQFYTKGIASLFHTLTISLYFIDIDYKRRRRKIVNFSSFKTHV